jgi:hypothetical protein
LVRNQSPAGLGLPDSAGKRLKQQRQQERWQRQRQDEEELLRGFGESAEDSTQASAATAAAQGHADPRAAEREDLVTKQPQRQQQVEGELLRGFCHSAEDGTAGGTQGRHHGQVLCARPSRALTVQQQQGGQRLAKPAQAATTRKLTVAKHQTAAAAAGAGRLRRQPASNDLTSADKTAAVHACVWTKSGRWQQGDKQQQNRSQQQNRLQQQVAHVPEALLAGLTKLQQRLLLRQGDLVAHWKVGWVVKDAGAAAAVT